MNIKNLIFYEKGLINKLYRNGIKTTAADFRKGCGILRRFDRECRVIARQRNEENKLSTPDFSTADNAQELALEVSCLKSLITVMLQAMGQADAGRVILKMEKQINAMEDQAQAAVFSSTVKQIKQAYRQ